jgi:histidinol-phosphate/aromatic aminotransferase/cobyric acid decarboxylase-like protein
VADSLATPRRPASARFHVCEAATWDGPAQPTTSRARCRRRAAAFPGIKLLPCENPLPPLDAAIAAARAELPCSNYYTEPYSVPLRRLLSRQLDVSESRILIGGPAEGARRELARKLFEQTAATRVTG